MMDCRVNVKVMWSMKLNFMNCFDLIFHCTIKILDSDLVVQLGKNSLFKEM